MTPAGDPKQGYTVIYWELAKIGRKQSTQIFVALHGSWEDMAVSKILAEGVGIVCPPGKPYSENLCF